MSGEKPSELSPEQQQNLRIEYQKAQDSAEHHDSLVWTATGLVVGGMPVLFAFALGHMSTAWGRSVVPIFGILLCLALPLFVENFRAYRLLAYQRCKEIEDLLGMKLHKQVDEERKKNCWLKVKQRRVVYLFDLLFFAGWVAILFCK